MLKVFSRLAVLLILLCGPICVPLLPRLLHMSAGFYLERYLAFFLVGAAWFLLRLLFVAVMKRHQQSGRALLRWTAALVFVAVTAIFFLSLQSFRLKFESYVFYGFLALLCADALAESLHSRRRLTAALLVNLLSQTGVGYLSLLVISNIWWWPPLLLALGMACLTVSVQAAGAVVHLAAEQPDPVSRPPQFYRAARVYPILVCLGPVLVSLLAVLKLAPNRFLLVLLIVPLATAAVNQMRALAAGSGPSGSLLREATGVCYLFAVMLVLLAII